MPDIIYANDFARKEPILKLHCISHKTLRNHKSDAFVFEYCGEFYLIDGGLPEATYVGAYLLEIRNSLLKDHPEYLSDPCCKLRLNWIISHFHTDHVGAVLEKLIPNPYLAFAEIFSPPDSDIAEAYQIHEKDGDERLRPQMREALRALKAPIYRIHDIPFGTEHQFTVTTSSGIGKEVSFTFLPPPRDLGEKWYMDYLFDCYKTESGGNDRMPVAAVYNSCVWVLAEFAGKKFLFTGDTMKREKYMYSEGLEFMMEAYAETIGRVDVLKFVHHGFVRNRALPAMLSFEPEVMIVSKTDSKIPELMERKYPDSKTKVVNVADETLVITCGYDGEKTLPLSLTWKKEI
jgi:hypothetical protein